MAVLKKGSKGKDVTKLQQRLNRLGAKPPIKEDGDFGKNTQKAVQDFQKKAKLKPDGVAGPYTFAALDYGGALPKMTVKSFAGEAGEYSDNQQFNAKFVNIMANLERVSGQLHGFLTEFVGEGRSMVKGNAPYWAQLIKIATEIDSRQRKFDAVLLKNPKAAAKMVQECEMLERKFANNLSKVQAGTKKVASKLDSTHSSIKSMHKDVDRVLKVAWENWPGD